MLLTISIVNRSCIVATCSIYIHGLCVSVLIVEVMVASPEYILLLLGQFARSRLMYVNYLQ